MKNPILLLLLASLFAFVGCSDDSVVAPTDTAPETEFPVNEDMPGVETEFVVMKTPTGDLVQTAVAGGFDTLVAAVGAADLVEALQGDDPLTVFAPTDEAFAKLPAGLVDQLLLPENKAKLQELLLYHVVPGQVNARDLRFFQRVETLQGSDLEIFRFFRLVLVNGVWVQQADVMATNGVIHVINEVLIPEGFSLDDPAEPTLDLVGTAVEGGFSTLVAAVQAAGLVEALQGGDPLTVFAPTNEAFDALPEGLVAELLLEENKELLTDLLLYHVTAGQVLSTDLRFYQRVEMLQGSKTYIFKNFRGDVRVNRSRVIAADVLATNGVVHAIDRVLIPRHFYGLFTSLPQVAPDYELEQAEL